MVSKGLCLFSFEINGFYGNKVEVIRYAFACGRKFSGEQ